MDTPKYYAHSANEKGDWQPLKDHLLNVAALAKKFADAAYSAGLLYDLPKGRMIIIHHELA